MNVVLERLCLNLYNYIEQEQKRRRERGELMLDHPRLDEVAVGSFIVDVIKREGTSSVRRIFWFLSADMMGALPGDSLVYWREWIAGNAKTEWRKLGDRFYDENIELIAECFLEMGVG